MEHGALYMGAIGMMLIYTFYLRNRLEDEVERRVKLRGDIGLVNMEIDQMVSLDPSDPDFTAGRCMGLRQAQRMNEAVLERDTRRSGRK